MFAISVFVAKMIFKLNLKIADYLDILDMTLNLTAAAHWTNHNGTNHINKELSHALIRLFLTAEKQLIKLSANEKIFTEKFLFLRNSYL